MERSINWRHLIVEIHDGAVHMSDDDALRVGMDQAVMLEEAAAAIRKAVRERERRSE